MTALYVGIAILATYRVAYLITSEDGPFAMAASFREWFVNPVTRLPRWPDAEWLTRGVNCVFCASFWLALIPALYLAWVWSLTLPDAALLWLGIAGGVVVVARMAR